MPLQARHSLLHQTTISGQAPRFFLTHHCFCFRLPYSFQTAIEGLSLERCHSTRVLTESTSA